MSTRRIWTGLPTSKMLSSCVRPGVFEVRASDLRLVSALSSELLPTFDRPAKAISGSLWSGSYLSSGADFTKSIGPANNLRARSAGSAVRIRW
jgi:hypothetical protein